MNIDLLTFGATVAGVTLCSIVSSFFAQWGLRKTRQFELFFGSRASAYFDFLCACNKISDMDDLAQLSSLYEASVRAQLFASAPTLELIKKCQQLSERFELAEQQDHIRSELIQSMQFDLQSDRLKPRRMIFRIPNKPLPRGAQNDKQQN